MDENLKNLIQELTSSQLVINWLELCGFETLEDIEYLNENVIADMESYIGSICSSMSFDEREKYIHVNLFKKFPQQFKFTPCLKSRLLNVADAISRQFNKSSQINRSGPFLSKFVQKFNKDYLADNGYRLCSRDLYDSVSNSIRRSFQNIKYRFDLEFDLYQSDKDEKHETKNGFFACSINQHNEICGEFIKFYIDQDSLSIDIEPILVHIELHLDRKSESSSIKTKSRILSSVEIDLNKSSRSIDLADAKLSNNFIHNEIIKFAEQKFIDCHLVQDIDFNVYEIIDDDSSLTNRGCFLCYICLKTKSNESKIKFFFTSTRSVVFTNIVAHLRIHFQSVAPFATAAVSRKRTSTKTPKHSEKRLVLVNSATKNSASSLKLEALNDKENFI
uniref:Uncharacterized protein n=1 Tax=Schmidtea mediterranea TaxID=79327 RepID=I1ZID3_SCHMD|nr:hypothetical protein [Schmidtea mediterranea]